MGSTRTPEPEAIETVMKEFREKEFIRTAGQLECDDAKSSAAPCVRAGELFRRAKGRNVFKMTATGPTIPDREDPDFDLLRSEATRLGTFYDWPSDALANPPDLAKAGLFYTGRLDRVQCAFCRNFLRSWTREDEPMVEHRKHFPDCAFVRTVDGGGRGGLGWVRFSNDAGIDFMTSFFLGISN